MLKKEKRKSQTAKMMRKTRKKEKKRFNLRKMMALKTWDRCLLMKRKEKKMLKMRIKEIIK
jgi:hypothetical protein